MAVNTFEDLAVQELKDLYDAEHQLVQALPKMVKAANNPQLKSAFETHLEETREQITRLEQVFEAMGKTASRKTCEAMKGLLKEATEALEEEMPADVKDAALIAAAQRVEHYEIAGYGTARTWAQNMGNDRAMQLLQTTLDEEEMTDKKLSTIANKVNMKAM